MKGQIRLPIRLANIVITQSFSCNTGTKSFVILGIDFFTIHKVSLHMGDTTMTIYHNSITKIHVIANDTGGARVAEITKIPASSNKNARIRV